MTDYEKGVQDERARCLALVEMLLKSQGNLQSYATANADNFMREFQTQKYGQSSMVLNDVAGMIKHGGTAEDFKHGWKINKDGQILESAKEGFL